MTIIYRVSPILSVNPNPLGKHKPFIIQKCFESLRQSLNGYRLIVINDGYETDLFDKYEVKPGTRGNVETFHQQLHEVCNLPNEEKVLLVEDDYLWRPDVLPKIDRALDEFEIITPYDHPGHYTEPRFITQPKLMRLIDDQVWREAPSSCLTFGCRAYVIKQNIDLIKSFGVRDHELFSALRDRGLFIYAPTPSFATHLVDGLLAPGWLLTESDLK